MNVPAGEPAGTFSDNADHSGAYQPNLMGSAATAFGLATPA